MGEYLTIENMPCQCEIYEICPKCAPTPEDYERAVRQRAEVLREADDDGSSDIS